MAASLSEAAVGRSFLESIVWLGSASSPKRYISCSVTSRSRQSICDPCCSSVWNVLATRLLMTSRKRFWSTVATVFCSTCRRFRSSWNSASSVCSSWSPHVDVSSKRIFSMMALSMGGSISEYELGRFVILRKAVRRSVSDGMTVEHTSSYSSEKKRSRKGTKSCRWRSASDLVSSSSLPSSTRTMSAMTVLTSLATASARSVS